MPSLEPRPVVTITWRCSVCRAELSVTDDARPETIGPMLEEASRARAEHALTCLGATFTEEHHAAP